MTTRTVRVLLVVCLSLVTSAASAEEPRLPLFGALRPGAHEVGFAKIRLQDPTRPNRPKRDASGAVERGDRSRRIDVHVWYPARTGPIGERMTFADYMIVHLFARDAEAEARRERTVREFIGRFGTLSAETWTRLKQTPLLAHRDAAPADGRFPLVIGALRPLSTSITNEYFASHGYVVAMVEGEPVPTPTAPGAGLEPELRDMEFAIPQLRALAYVDPAALAALGFSGSGFSQILLAMRHPDVDAVCDLESAIFDDRLMFPLHLGWGFDPLAMRAAFLHTYSVPLSKLENRFSDFEAMRYATRYHYLVDAPGIHHWDFATEGMAASVMPGLRGEHAPRLRQAFETTNRYVLAFFDAYVKGDQQALAFLRRDPAANGAPVGLATIRELPRIEPAPTSDAMVREIAERGIEQGMRLLREARARDPEATIFREPQLNQLGYTLLRTDKIPEAIAIFRMVVELHARSANTYDSLSEALELAGQRPEAAAVCAKGLEVLAKEEMPPERRKALQDLLEARLARLR